MIWSLNSSLQYFFPVTINCLLVFINPHWRIFLPLLFLETVERREGERKTPMRKTERQRERHWLVASHIRGTYVQPRYLPLTRNWTCDPCGAWANILMLSHTCKGSCYHKLYLCACSPLLLNCTSETSNPEPSLPIWHSPA